MPSKPLPLGLEVTGLSWGCAGRPILNNISFSVGAGQMIGVLGPNGVGKSSLLRCLYRYLTPDSGSIRLQGVAVETIPRKRFAQQVAVVLQQMQHEFDMSVAQLLSTGFLPHRRWWQWPNHAAAAAVSATLAQVGLQKQAQQRLSSLSGGEMQRLLIGRALLQQPGLLLLDEPTNHLDVRYQIEILQLIRSLGITVIATIHDLNLAAAFCDQLLLMEAGQIAAFGTPQQVLSVAQLSQVYGVKSCIDAHPHGGQPRVSFAYQQEREAIA